MEFDKRLTMRVNEDFLRKLDDLRLIQKDSLSRPEMIRRLVDHASTEKLVTGAVYYTDDDTDDDEECG